MDREKAKAVRETVADLIEDAMDSMGLSLISSRGNYNDNSIRITINLVDKDVITKPAKTSTTQQEVDAGLAQVGALLWAKDEGEYYRAIVLNTRRTKYLFKYKNYPELGSFITSFRNLKVDVPKNLISEGEE